MNNDSNNNSVYQELKFRRQFLVSPDKYAPNKHWQNKELNHGLFLSIHEDLNSFTEEKNGRMVTLVGLAIDCTSPYRKQSAITSLLLNHFIDIQSVIKASKPLSGRWVIICQDTTNTYIFTDPCGLRSVFYHSKGKEKWFASQPTLINQVKELSFNSDKSVINFIESTEFENNESAWIGNKTRYKNCYHLMPNHYLDLDNCNQVRFFPKKKLSINKNIEEATTKAATYLKNIMNGLSKKYNLKIGLSAGFDSRLLLAASTDISNSISYVTSKGNLQSYHHDIYIPKNLSEKLNLNHTVLKNTDREPPIWFCTFLSQNVSDARVSSPVLPKITSIYHELVNKKTEHILVSGNVTEIVRVEEKRLKSHSDKANSKNKILDYSGYDYKYVEQEIEYWINDVNLAQLNKETVTIIDLYYWEQRMGNWGALFPAEMDIAAESISPFNCRLLLETCLQVPRNYRKAPQYRFFKEIIRKLWPETLSEPINPGPRGLGLFKKYFRENLPSRLVRTIQMMLNNF